MTPLAVLEAVGVILLAYVLGVLVSLSSLTAGVMAWREAVKVAQNIEPGLTEEGSHHGTED